MNTSATFLTDQYYHIYNRTNNKESMFRSDENRSYFLRQYKKFLGSFFHIHSYALMGNHFHFSVQVRSQEEIDLHVSTLSVSELTKVLQDYRDHRDHIALSDQISQAQSDQISINDVIVSQHRRFFISYSQAFNKMYNRQGNLLNAKFKRSAFDPELKFRYLQYYIHHNGRKHGVVNDFKDYAHHSYQEIVDGSSALIDRSKVLEWYKDIEDFTAFHESVQYEDVFRDIDIEGLLG